LSDIIQYEFEPVNKPYFYENFSTDKYLNYSQYSGADTCPNAVQMLYKMARVYAMAHNFSLQHNINYDIVVRIRPDIVYNHRLNVNEIKQCLYSQDIFMPYHHGKYEVVTKYIMDHFFLGCQDTMNKIMLAYTNIQTLLGQEDCPHTCEGFIWKQIVMRQINIQLFNMKYSVIRANNVIETVIN
jgi:hypothetical protein